MLPKCSYLWLHPKPLGLIKLAPVPSWISLAFLPRGMKGRRMKGSREPRLGGTYEALLLY